MVEQCSCSAFRLDRALEREKERERETEGRPRHAAGVASFLYLFLSPTCQPEHVRISLSPRLAGQSVHPSVPSIGGGLGTPCALRLISPGSISCLISLFILNFTMQIVLSTVHNSTLQHFGALRCSLVRSVSWGGLQRRPTTDHFVNTAA